MKKRAFINIFIAFILLPISFLIKIYLEREVFDARYSEFSFLEWLKYSAITTFILGPLLFLMFVLLPYNYILTRDSVYNRSIPTKFFIFLGILIAYLCIIGSTVNIWLFPIWKNIYHLAALSVLASVCTAIIHFGVDKKQQEE